MQGILVGDNTDEEEHQGGRHQVQRRTTDGLVRPQVDGGKRQKQRKNRPQKRRHHHRHDFQPLQGGVISRCLGRCENLRSLHGPHEKDAYKRAKNHDAFQGQVDDAASFREDAGQRHNHQGNRVD